MSSNAVKILQDSETRGGGREDARKKRPEISEISQLPDTSFFFLSESHPTRQKLTFGKVCKEDLFVTASN